MSTNPMAQPEVSTDQLKPDAIKTPKLFVLLLLTTSGGLSDAVVRVSSDITSAHAFAQAFLLNKFPYLYTELAITGVNRPPIPDVVHLALAQKEPWDLRSMGLGLFQDLDEAKDACSVMSAKDAEFTQFEVKTCPIQLGLTEEDAEYLDQLTEQALEKEMAALKAGEKDESNESSENDKSDE